MSQKLIDVHTHIYPDSYIRDIEQFSNPPMVVKTGTGNRLFLFSKPGEKMAGSGIPITTDYSEISRKLKFDDRYGISHSVISLGNPWFDNHPTDLAIERAYSINTQLSNICSESNGRISMFASIPTTTLDAAINELDNIRKLPNVVGVIMGTRLGGRWFDSHDALPFWSKVVEVSLPIFINPHYGTGIDDISDYEDFMRPSLAFPFETTVAVSRLIFSGVLDQFPRLKIILAHAGGSIMTLAGRLESYAEKLNKGHKPKGKLIDYLKRFYYDSITYNPIILRTVIQLVGSDRLLFGTDYPFSAKEPDELIETLELANLDRKEKREIMFENAQKLFQI